MFRPLRYFLSLVLCLQAVSCPLLVNAATSPTTPAIINAPLSWEDIKILNSKSTYDDNLKRLNDAMEQWLQAVTLDTAKRVASTLTWLPILPEHQGTEHEFDKKKAYETLLSTLVVLTDEEQAQLFQEWAPYALKQAKQTEFVRDYLIAEDLVAKLPASAEKLRHLQDLAKLYERIFKQKTGYIDWDNPPDDLKMLPAQKETYSEYKPGFEPKQPPVVKWPKTDITRTQTTFERQGNACYEVKTTRVNRKVIHVEKTPVQNAVLALCGAKSPTFTQSDLKRLKTGQTIQQAVPAGQWSPRASDESLNVPFPFKPSQPKPLLSYHLQLKLPRQDAKDLVGFDLPSTGEISYIQAKELLQQTAAETEIPIFDDIGQFAILLNGQLFVIHQWEPWSIEKLNRYLAPANVRFLWRQQVDAAR